MIRKIFSASNDVVIYRIILVIIILLYLSFGLVYKISASGVDPFPRHQRVLTSLLFLIVLFFSFVSDVIKSNLYKIIYLLIYISTFQLIYFAYVNKYSINYAISILAVIIVADFMLRTILQLRYYNAIIALIVSLSVFLTSDSLLNKHLYVFVVLLISFTSYVIHSLRLQFLAELKESKERYFTLYEQQDILLNNIEIQVWYLKDINKYGIVNDAHANFLGSSKEKLKNKNIRSLFSPQQAKKYIALNRLVFNNKKQIEFESWIKNYQGEKRLLLVTMSPKLDEDNQVEYLICNAKDITENRKANQKIEYLNFHDSLTGLYNRRGFEQKLKELNSKSQLPLSMIVGDINGLKLTNDAFGHQVGDKLLAEAAQILKNSCRKEDIVARWGGDEFVILLPRTTKENTKKICSRIKKKCKQRNLDLLEVSISLGYATKTNINEDIDEVWKEADDWMYNKKLSESKSFHNSVISSLEETLKKKTNETVEHSKRVKELALEIGRELNLSDSKLDNLKLLARLHDLGKVAISNQILLKPGSLTEEEWEEMKRHPKIGFQIVESSSGLYDIAQGILSHHEWWDGSGYPQGLKQEEIPLSARIISIVDAYDVMTNNRPYKEAMSKQQALEEIKAGAGSQFDPQLADLFIELVDDRRGNNGYRK
ncbi:sensor domain-containing diguanylate cyclase/phosphohydrolase [Halanaerobaculum tunisiense]